MRNPARTLRALASMAGRVPGLHRVRRQPHHAAAGTQALLAFFFRLLSLSLSLSPPFSAGFEFIEHRCHHRRIIRKSFVCFYLCFACFNLCFGFVCFYLCFGFVCFYLCFGFACLRSTLHMPTSIPTRRVDQISPKYGQRTADVAMDSIDREGKIESSHTTEQAHTTHNVMSIDTNGSEK